MGVKVTNNAFGTLSAAINTTATTITLDSGQGARFPTLGASDYFYGTLVDTSNNLEIVKVTARSTDSLTVVRGQDGTTATSFAIGDRFELRPVAALFEDIGTQGITSTAAGTAITIDSSNNTTVEENLTVDGGVTVDNSAAGGRGIVTARGDGQGYTQAHVMLKAIDSGRGLGVYHYNETDGYEWFAGNPYGSGSVDGSDKYHIRRKDPPTNVGDDTANGSVVFAIDSDGRVSLPSQVGFFARMSTHVTTSGVIKFDSVTFNRGSHYSTSTGRFTAPVSGVYFFSFSCLLYGMGYATNASLRVNASNYGGMSSFGTYGQFTGSYAGQGASCVAELSANDYVDINVSHAGTSFHNNYTWWSGFKIG